jgi:transaldolase
MIIYCDGADLATMKKYANDPLIDGFTTNPSLMRKAGIKHYEDFAMAVLEIIGDKAVSFEVVSDDFDEMYMDAQKISKWGENVYVKIPITNTKGESSIPLIDDLSDYRLNITAVMTEEQLDDLRTVDRPHHIISVFAGRIKDAGRQPPIIHKKMKAKMLWASTRETHDIDDATIFGYDIITMTPDLLAKMRLRGKNLKEYSLETVKQFYEDGRGIEF